jgi:uncharacterized RDD family membrane protein YckC
MTSPLNYAHLHQRALAWVLDVFLLTAVLSPLVYLLNIFAASHIDSDTGMALFRLLRLLLVLGTSLVALGVCTTRLGGTPGKILLGLQVIDSASHHWLSPGKAMLRILLSIPVAISGIGMLMMYFNDQRQAFHDSILHTLVIVREANYAEDTLPENLG